MASHSLFLTLLLIGLSISASAATDRLTPTLSRHPTTTDSDPRNTDRSDNPSTTEPGAIEPGSVYPGAGTAYPYGVYPGGTYPGSVYPGYGYGGGFPPAYPYYFPPYYNGPNGGVPGYYPGSVYPGGNYPNTRPYHIYPAPEIPTVP